MPSPKLKAAVRRQLDFIRSAAEAEFSYLLERVGEPVSGSHDTPVLKRVLSHWYEGRTLDMPPGSHREVEDDFQKFYAESPWPSRRDEDSIPLPRCRALLGLGENDISDAEVRFQRDALHALAEVLVRPEEPRSAPPGSAMVPDGVVGGDGDVADDAQLGRLLRWPTGDEDQ